MATVPLLDIDRLAVAIGQNDRPGSGPAVDKVSLRIDPGQAHAIIGPADAGGSTLAETLLGSTDHAVTGGRILLQGDDITTWSTDVRAKAGLFLAFGRPPAVGGVTVLQLLHRAVGASRARDTSVAELRRGLIGWTRRLGIDPSLLEHPLDDDRWTAVGLRGELLQLAVLDPVVAVIDATADDLDDDTLETVASGIRAVRGQRPSLGTLTITQSRRLLDHLQPDHLHVMVGGRIVASGGPDLAIRLDTEGYESFP